ncbi:penicillin-binding protein 2 [Candidatus Saccharibacteria bacterium]|nr:penicillin-binding protein 2 [Candidatus Saccharibacteria bacterium]
MTSREWRYFWLKIGLLCVAFIFLARLFFLQIIQHQYYVKEANAMRIRQYELLAKRGQVYFMDGEEAVVPAIMNERTWTIFVDPYYIMKNAGTNGVLSKEEVQEKLTEVLGDKIIAKWDKVWANEDNMYYEIAKQVDYNTVVKIKEMNLRGVGRKETSRRVYPEGRNGAQLLGFINAEGVGSGVEGALNYRLTGKNGMLKTVTDVNEIPITVGDDNIEIPAEDGENIVLTVDANVQRKVEKVLEKTVKNKKGGIAAASAMVMDPNTGRIMAMANYPNYDPEKYWVETDPNIYVNRVAETPYEPASVCKPFTYAAALNEGKLNPDGTYNNTGETRVGDRIINNAYGTATRNGIITYRKALDYSLNTGSIEVLRKLGDGKNITKGARTTLYNYLTDNFGLGRKTGIEIYEAAGKIISPEDQEGNAVRYANMTFGQGMNLTMLQVAAGFSSLINGGLYYQPTIIAGTYEDGKLMPAKQQPAVRRSVSEGTSKEMRKMLQEVRSVNGGANDLKGYRVGVKTGTAETLDKNGRYTSNKTVAGALGFGGANKDGEMPQYVIMIRLDGNILLWGSLDAIPVFTEISNFMLQYLRIEPIK